MRFFRQIQGCAQARTVGARFKIRVTKADVSGIILIYRLLNIYFWNSIYTAGGDRSLKLTGANQQMLINNQYYINFANLNENKSLYMGAYMVLTNSNYTKHYYIEGERVCTKIGGGFGPGPNIPFKGELHPLMGDYETMRHELWEMTMRFRECTQGPDIAINENLEPGHNGEDNFEELQYFYHPDHLGSSSFITDATGYAVQHLQYLPFGETFVDQQNGYDSRYTFSAKEKDDETQYSYFGARYYDSDLSVWLSVDPMSDEYPSMSPYMYCAGNPVKIVDPNGMWLDDVFKNSETGEVSIVKTNDNFDREFVDGKEVAQHEKGWGEATYTNARKISVGDGWNTQYLKDENNSIVALLAIKFNPTSEEDPGVFIDLGVFNLAGEGSLGFSQSYYCSNEMSETGNGIEILPGGYFSDNNEKGYYGGTTYFKGDTRAQGFDVLMGDWPSRPGLQNVTMVLENSVVWSKGNSTTRLHTIKYGFQINNFIKTNILPVSLELNNISKEHLGFLPK
ncbi:MAG: RHS repeat domain-containing protein [Bacteroidales bacterium]